MKAFKEKDKSGQNKKIIDLISEMEKDSTLILRMLEVDRDTLELFYSVSDKAINLVEMDYPEVNISFLNVLFKYLDPELRNYAFRWLQGDYVSQEYLDQLGVKESIDNEQTAQSILYSVMKLSQKPILLCFDQFESIYDRFKDVDLLTAFFDTIVRICNETPNSLVLLMVQSAVWTSSIEPNIQKSALDRIEFRSSLKTPTLDELVEIVALRIKPIYVMHPYPPENKIYPFTVKYLEEIAIVQGWNPRSVLKVLSDMFQKVKLDQALNIILNPDVSGSPIVIEDIKTQTKEEFIEEQFKTNISNYSDDLVENPFSNRENYLEAGLYDIFTSLKQFKDTKILEAQILDVIYKKKTKDLDMILKIDNRNKKENWGLEICNAENHATVGKVLKKIKDHLDNHLISRWVLIRDIHLPIKPSWKKTNEIIDEISSLGKILFIDQNNSSKVVAYKELLDTVSTGDILYDNIQVNRSDIDQYFFKDIFPKIPLLFSIFSQIEMKEALVKEFIETPRAEGKIQSEDIILREKLLTVASKRILVNIGRNIENYLEKKEEYNKIIDTLVNEKKILIITKNQVQGQIIFTKNLEESIF